MPMEIETTKGTPPSHPALPGGAPRAKIPRSSEFLCEELQRRKARNKRYSLRALARDVGLSPAYLSQLATGRRGFTPELAQRLSSALKLEDWRARLFTKVVELEGTSSGTEHAKTALREVESLMRRGRLFFLSDADALKVIAEWQHNALVALVSFLGANSSVARLAKRLGISEPLARESLERLLASGLIRRTETGGYERSHDEVVSIPPTPAPAIRMHHAQMLEKARVALETQPAEAREFTSLTFSMKAEHLAELKRRIHEFCLETLCSVPKADHDAVFQLCVQAFRLDIPEETR